jgi:hypothetical protein
LVKSSTYKSCQSVKRRLCIKTREIHIRLGEFFFTTQSNDQVIKCDNRYLNKEEHGRTYLEVVNFTMKEDMILELCTR